MSIFLLTLKFCDYNLCFYSITLSISVFNIRPVKIQPLISITSFKIQILIQHIPTLLHSALNSAFSPFPLFQGALWRPRWLQANSNSFQIFYQPNKIWFSQEDISFFPDLPHWRFHMQTPVHVASLVPSLCSIWSVSPVLGSCSTCSFPSTQLLQRRCFFSVQFPQLSLTPSPMGIFLADNLHIINFFR